MTMRWCIVECLAVLQENWLVTGLTSASLRGKIPVAAEKSRPDDATFLPPLTNDSVDQLPTQQTTGGAVPGSIGEVA